MVKRKLEAFSLMEISIALIIIGVLIGSVLKGSQLIETAKIQGTVRQFQELKHNIEHYAASFGALPGIDARASQHFPDAQNGDGINVYNGAHKTRLAMHHLFKAGLVTCDNLLSGKIGGYFQLHTIGDRHFITLLGSDDKGFLSTSQIRAIKKGLIGSEYDQADEGDVYVQGCTRNNRIVPQGHSCLLSYQIGS